MASRVKLNDPQQESRIFRNRAIVAAVACLLIICILVLRLIYLQVIHHDTYSTLSLNNRLKVKPMAPNRGLIYDRNGVVLAENRPSFHLGITAEEVDNMDDTLSRLRTVVAFNDSDLERFQQEQRRKGVFESVPLRFNLTEDEVANFYINRHRFPGVDIETGLSRYYPFADATAHVLGYIGRIDERDLANVDETNYRATSYIGKVGLERQYETLLHGQVGYQHLEVNVQGRVLGVLEAEQMAVPGHDLHLHLDIELQQAALDALGDYSGSVVAMDPNNGALLVLVSKPAYDPNLFVAGIGEQQFQALQQSPSRPLFNRALQGQYPPGSTIKPVLGLASLESRLDSVSHRVRCKGFYKLAMNERKYRDWKKQGHGEIDLQQAIAQSCDVFFYDLAYRMGISAMAEYLALFGLGQLTEIDIPGEKAGLLPTPAWKRQRFENLPWFPGETLITGIGQGYMLMTPLQLAQMASILATGKAYRPQLVAATQPADGAQQTVATKLHRELTVNNAENWAYIRQAMEDVVHGRQGTARGISRGISYRIAGKTGTVQVIGIPQDEEYDESAIAKEHRDHALFIAYAPVEQPQLALAILVENSGHGGAIAAPIARRLFDLFFQPLRK